MTTREIVLSCALLMIAGCASVSFKRGASPEAMSADEEACRQAGGDEAAYVECMQKRGFYVMDPKGEGASAVAPAPTQPLSAPGPGDGDGPPDAVAPAPLRTPQATVTPTLAAVAPPPKTPETPDAGEHGLTKIEVKSWWKLGGGPGDLDRAIDVCVDRLGPEHRPDPGATLVTAEMHACLREVGWYSLGGDR